MSDKALCARLGGLAIALVLSSCASLPDSVSMEEGRILVRGEMTDLSDVRIRSVDGGEVLWLGKKGLSTEVWLDPGPHRLSLMCTTESRYGPQMAPAELTLEADAGRSYVIHAAALELGQEVCEVSVAGHDAS